ncbi:MAG: PEP-CTERM sorting domain-containing protein [Planctomycetota bacterium]
MLSSYRHYTPLVLASVVGSTASASAVFVNDTFDAASNPGWISVVNADAVTQGANPTFDFTGADLAFTTGTVSNTGNAQALDNSYILRPFDTVNLANPGDFIQVQFTLSTTAAQFNPEPNTLNVIRNLRLTLIGEGNGTLPTGDTTYSGSDFAIDQTAYNIGAQLTGQNNQAIFVSGNQGGGGGGSSNLFSSSVGGAASPGGNTTISDPLGNGEVVTMLLERLADNTSTVPGGEPEFQLTLTVGDATALVGTYRGNRSDRVLGTDFSAFAIGSADRSAISANGDASETTLVIDNFTISSNTVDPIPEPASLMLLALGSVVMVGRRRR